MPNVCMADVRLIVTVIVSSSVLACAPAGERGSTADSTAARGAVTGDSGTARSADSAWVVRPGSIGPVRVGMTAEDARRVLGMPAGAKTGDGCAYIAGTAQTKLRANVMLAGDTVVRFDVLDEGIATAEGARVGDSEQRIRQLYQGRVAEQPHKYVPGGHYLVVTPAGESVERIIFETDGHVVTKYRAGRRPEVENVEGCG